MKKSFLSAMLCIVLIISQFNIVFAEGYTDDQWQQKEQLLDALGILPKTEQPEEITVGMAANACLALLGNRCEDDESAVGAAQSSGIISKDITEGNVNYTVLTEMLLATLGYDAYFEKDELIQQVIYADSIDLFDGISVTDSNQELDYPTFVTLIYNALYVNLMEQSALGEYRINNKETVLTKYLDISYAEGIVTQDFNTSLYSADARNGYAIDGIAYDADKEFGVYVGYYVAAYIIDEKIVYMYATRKNNCIEINGKDIVDASTTKSKIAVWVNGRIKTYNIDFGASYIYNNVYLGWVATNAVDLSLLCDDNMTYTLVDNDNDGAYECLFGNGFTYIKISQKDADKNSLYDEWSGARIELLEDDVVRYSDGIACKITDIKKNDIVAVKVPFGANMENRNNKLEFIILTRYSSGYVNGTWDEGIVIDGVEYTVNPSFRYDTSSLIGKYGDFVLDMNGSLIEFVQGENTASSYKTEYAYIDELRMTEDDTVIVRLLATDGYKKMYLAEKASLEKGETRLAKGCEEVYANKSEAEGKITVIKYSGEEISKITLPETLAYGQRGTGALDEFNTLASRTYKCRGTVLQDLYRVKNTNALIFCVPDNGDKADYKTITWANYSHGEDVELALYGVDENYNFEMALLVTKSGFSDKIVHPSNSILIVESTYMALNDDDEVCVGIKGYTNGAPINLVFKEADAQSVTNSDDMDNLYVKHSLPANQLEFGDIIQYTLTEDGNIDGFRVLLDKSYDVAFQRSMSGSAAKDGWNWSFNSPFVAKDLIYAYGTLSGKGKEFATLTIGQTSGGDDNLRNVFNDNLKYIYKCDSGSGQVELTTLADPDIRAGLAAFVTFDWSNERDLVVYY